MQFSGTPTYMAPEMFLKRPYSEAVDIFAFGTLLWEVYAGEVPYDGFDPSDIKDRVVKDPALPTKPAVPPAILTLVNECRQSDPAKRPSAESLAARLVPK
jgi:serine/threonine protein kinase